MRTKENIRTSVHQGKGLTSTKTNASSHSSWTGWTPSTFLPKILAYSWPDEVTNSTLNALNHGMDIQDLNHTFICLIPKVKRPSHVREFHLISLCNIIFKLITKTIANRMRHVLPYIVGPYQSAFVPGRLLTNNALITFEIFHFMRKKKTGKIGLASLMLDMAKAYDRVKYEFLEKVLRGMGFLEHWVTLIMRCVTSISLLAMLSGSPCDVFGPERGLRQGDPLSPYLFILCAEIQSGLIVKAQERQAIRGVRVTRSAPEISHIFFADDSIMFF